VRDPRSLVARAEEITKFQVREVLSPAVGQPVNAEGASGRRLSAGPDIAAFSDQERVRPTGLAARAESKDAVMLDVGLH